MDEAQDPGRSTYIPGLTGVRALAVLGVFAIHLGWIGHLPARVRQAYSPGGVPLPVLTFFVLSGYLICHLVLREEARTGRFSVSGFYRRRLLRIAPCYSVFLLAVGLLGAVGTITLDRHHYLLSWLYLGNATDYGHYDRVLAHTWSLAVEEHFYLVLPFVMVVVSGRRRLPLFVVALVGCSIARHRLLGSTLVEDYPVVRFSVPAADAILAGCCAALAADVQRLRSLPALPAVGAGLVLVAVPGLMPAADQSAAYVASVLGVLLLLCSLIARPHAAVVRALEVPVLRGVGTLSYGLYVWQGLFLRNGPSDPEWVLQRFPWNVVGAGACATASYFLVERPFLRLKNARSSAVPPSGGEPGGADITAPA